MSAPTKTLGSPESEKSTVSVIVPTYREAENIEELVQRVSNTFDKVDELLEIIVVDDNSRDGTDQKIAELQEQGCRVRMIERTDQRGLSSAVLRGFDEAKGDYLVCMDADLSHPPESLPNMIETLAKSQTEMVVGSRYVPGGSTDESWGFFRKLNSRIATLLARPFTSIKDPMAGFFALPKEVYNRTRQWDPIGYKIGLEILVKAECRRVKEVPIHFEDRRRGESKLCFTEQLRYLQHLGRLSRFKYKTLFQFLKFATVGSSGLLVDLCLFSLIIAAGVPLLLARAISISITLAWNFAFNNRWTFRCDSNDLLPRFRNYLCSCAAGALTSFLFTVISVSSSSTLANYSLAVAFAGITAGGCVNFLLSKHWVFALRSASSNPKDD